MEALVGVIIFFVVLMFAIEIIVIVSMWKLYAKAGKPGWASIVPVYNLLVFFQIIGKPWWWLFLFIIPILNFIWIIWAWNLMAKSFGKPAGYTVGIIFLGFIFIPMLGLGSSQYIGPGGQAASQPIVY